MTIGATRPKSKEKRPSRRRPARGALVVVATLFISSGLLRIGLEAGHAFARESVDELPAAHMANVKGTCETPEDLRETLELFRDREARIAKREAQIADRIQALAVADKEIEARLAELVQAESDLRKLLVLADEAAEGDLARLTSVYEAMKPKDAAALFEEMAPEFASGFLSRMKPEAAAGIMSGLSPQVAYTLSAVMAGRNANAPKK